MINLLKWIGQRVAEAWIRAAALAMLAALGGLWYFAPIGDWVVSAPPWLPTAFLGMSLAALISALVVGRFPTRRKPRIIRVHDTGTEFMWMIRDLHSQGLLWWVDRDIDQLHEPEEIVIGPFHSKKNCMRHLQEWKSRTYIVPQKCACGDRIYGGNTPFPVDRLKIDALKTLQRLHHQGVRIKNGLRFNSISD